MFFIMSDKFALCYFYYIIFYDILNILHWYSRCNVRVTYKKLIILCFCIIFETSFTSSDIFLKRILFVKGKITVEVQLRGTHGFLSWRDSFNFTILIYMLKMIKCKYNIYYTNMFNKWSKFFYIYKYLVTNISTEIRRIIDNDRMFFFNYK